MFEAEIDSSPTPSAAPAPSLDLKRCALFLDLDGTLAAIEPRPEAVGPEPRRNRVVSELAGRMGGRVAVLSGRSIAEIDRILDGGVVSAAGVHGLERRTSDGERVDMAPHPSLSTVEGMLESFARGQRGLLLERKSRSLALHYRGHPPAEEACLEFAHRIGFAYGLSVQEGRMVVELRTPGPDKGDALRAFMSEPLFAGATPIMVGDDLTDEHAFEAAIEYGGAAVLVGAPRPTAATARLEDPAAVVDWLEEALA